MIYKTLSTIVYNIWLMCINLEPTQPKYLFLRIFILFLKHYSLSVYFRCIFGSAILNSHKHLLFFLYFKIALGHRPLFSNAAFCVFLQASFVQSLSYIRELMIINNGKWKKKNLQRNYKHIFIIFENEYKTTTECISQRTYYVHILCVIDDFRRYFRINFVLLFSDGIKKNKSARRTLFSL